MTFFKRLHSSEAVDKYDTLANSMVVQGLIWGLQYTSGNPEDEEIEQSLASQVK